MKTLLSKQRIIVVLIILLISVLGVVIYSKGRNKDDATSLARTLHTGNDIAKNDPLAAVLPYYQPTFSVTYREDFSSGQRIVVPILITTPGATPAQAEAARNAMLAYFAQNGIDGNKYYTEYTSEYLTIRNLQVTQD